MSEMARTSPMEKKINPSALEEKFDRASNSSVRQFVSIKVKQRAVSSLIIFPSNSATNDQYGQNLNRKGSTVRPLHTTTAVPHARRFYCTFSVKLSALMPIFTD
jgi:hypothetical protein